LQGWEANLSPLSNAEVTESLLYYTCTPSYFLLTWYLIKHGDKTSIKLSQ
jgi:hypothetical protein